MIVRPLRSIYTSAGFLAVLTGCSLIPAMPSVEAAHAGALAVLPSKPELGLIGSEFHIFVAVSNEAGRLLYEVDSGDESCALRLLNPGRYRFEFLVKRLGTPVSGSARSMVVSIATGDVFGIRVAANGIGLVTIQRDTSRVGAQDVASIHARLRANRACDEIPRGALSPAGN